MNYFSLDTLYMESTDQKNLKWQINDAIDADAPERPFLDHQLLYSYDTNNSGVYSSNQLEFNTQSSANSGRISHYGNGAFLDIPLVIAVTETGIATTADNLDYLLALKNSNVCIVNSINVDFNSTSVVNAGVENLPVYRTYLKHEKESIQSEEIFGYSDGYFKDGNMFQYSEASLSGLGVTNNRLTGPYANPGLKKRCEQFVSIDDSHSLAMCSEAVLRNASLNYKKRVTNNTVVYYYSCQIPLTDLHDIFNKIPLTKGLNLKIRIFLNLPLTFTCIKVAAVAASAGPPAVLAVPAHIKMTSCSITGGSQIQPFMITAADATDATLGSNKWSDSETLTVKCGICNVQVGADTYAHVKTQARLYYHSYRATAEYESRFISDPIKSIRYSDIYNYNVTVDSGQYFNAVLSTTIARPSRLIIAGFLTQASNGTGNIGGQLLSPFDSAPGTTAPMASMIENLQVKIDDNTRYITPITYSYEHFLQEQAGRFGASAGLSPEICSSRLSMKDFQKNFGYIVVDLTHREKSYDNIQHSIVITGKSVHSKQLQLFCFIESDKTISLNTITGAIEM